MFRDGRNPDFIADNKPHTSTLNWSQSVQCTSGLNRKLSCRRETARCFVSLNISLSHTRSLTVI